MKLLSLEYHDHDRKWSLQRTSFSDLTLLVGISGVGKTQILSAIRSLKDIAGGKNRPGVEWELDFSTYDGVRFKWRGAFELGESGGGGPFPDLFDDEEFPPPTSLRYEQLFREGELVLDRREGQIHLEGKEMPKLSPNESTLRVLREEDVVKPAHDAFKRILHSEHMQHAPGLVFLEPSQFGRMLKKHDSFAKIQEAELDVSLKLALAYEKAPEVFEQICERFTSMFPQVTDIRVSKIDNLVEAPFWMQEMRLLQIKEQGVQKWILQPEWSSGMYRTIMQLAALFLSRDGTVMLIDEFENSLGVNCIDVLTEDLLGARRSLQFIITSHHPYIINNVGPEYWKIVRRVGGQVSTHDASELSIGESRHDAFLQLINVDAFIDGVETR